MKKAKIILASVAILAVVGGALAFKTSRFLPPNIYTISGTKLSTITTAVGGPTYSAVIPNCTLTNLVTTNQGSQVVVSTSSTRNNVTAAFTHQPSGNEITATYAFCTTILTRTTLAD